MDAKHARDMAMLITHSKNERQFDEVITLITRAVSHGRLNVNIYDYIDPDTRKKLVDLKYTVGSSIMIGDSYCTTIQW